MPIVTLGTSKKCPFFHNYIIKIYYYQIGKPKPTHILHIAEAARVGRVRRQANKCSFICKLLCKPKGLLEIKVKLLCKPKGIY